jgi:hypothetical protein
MTRGLHLRIFIQVDAILGAAADVIQSPTQTCPPPQILLERLGKP